MSSITLPKPIGLPGWIVGGLGVLLGLWLAFATITSNPFATDVTTNVGCDCGSVNPDAPCIAQDVSYTLDGYTIGFEFQCDGGDCYCGQFADQHSFWVAPQTPGNDVTITAMTPTETGSGSTLRHGSMADPTTDDAAYDGESLSVKTDVNTGLTLSLPYTASPSTEGRPIVITKAESLEGADRTTYCNTSQRMCLGYVETLTVLDEPPGDVFRPPLYGIEKPLIDASNFDMSWLSDLAALPSALSWSDAVDAMITPMYAEFIASWHVGRQAWRSRANYQINRGYPGFAMAAHVRAVMKLSEETNDQTEADQKEQLARSVAQRGIDLYYMHKAGRDWPGFGGFGGGKLTVIVASASLLQQSDWLTTLNTNISTHNGRQYFAETGFIQPAQGFGRDIPLFGHLTTFGQGATVFCKVGGNSNCADIGTKCAGSTGGCTALEADYLGRADGEPEGPSGVPTAYQQCCTHGQWLGSAMTVWMNPRIENNWPANADHFLEYMNRSREDGVTVGSEFGTYASTTVTDFTITGFDVDVYDSAEYYEAWDTYKACSEARTCAGLGQE